MVSRCLGLIQTKVQLHFSTFTSSKGLIEYLQCPKQYRHNQNSEKDANNRRGSNSQRDPLQDDVGMVVPLISSKQYLQRGQRNREIGEGQQQPLKICSEE